MQQSDLRSHFDVASTAQVRRSSTFRPWGNSRGVVLLALVAVAVGWQFSFSSESDEILLDFTASWCGPCQQMSPIVSRLERQGAPIRKVDIDKEPELARKFKVGSIPCFVLVSGGREIDRVTGLTTEKQLVGMMKRLQDSPAKTRPTSGNSNEDLAGTPRLGVPVPISLPKTSDRQKNSTSNGSMDFAGNSKSKNGVGPEMPKFLGQNDEETTDPLQATVRIRVKDSGAVNFGTGTIIDSRPGRSVILTCGHLFRKLGDEAVVEVDLYLNSKSAKPDTVVGKVLYSDLNADVGVLTIATPRPLPSVKLALQDKPLVKSERLVSVGCSGGDKPTRDEHQLTAINKYDGADNLECSGMPQQGRSGGGLFRGNELVGVCVAADAKQKRGIYTGLNPIGAVLDRAGLASLFPRLPTTLPNGTDQFAELSTGEGDLVASDAGTSGRERSGGGIDDLNRLLENELNLSGDASDEMAGAEVVCIVRSKTPGVPSRIVIVNQASRRFVADLLHESRPSTMTTGLPMSGNKETSFESKPYRRNASK